MDVQTIIQGGAVGLSALLIFVLFRVVQMLFKFASNHVNHNTEVTTELRDAIRELTTYLKNGK